jgi:hypothetical protein
MPSAVPFPHQCDRPWRGIVGEGRKLVLGPDGRAWLYFDLKNDPCEMENLVGLPGRRREIDSLRAELA